MNQKSPVGLRRVKNHKDFLAAIFLLLAFGVARAEIQVLHTFDNAPQYPQSQLVQAADGNFYGVTPQGGSAGGGTLFRANPTGGVTVMASFTGGAASNPRGGRKFLWRHRVWPGAWHYLGIFLRNAFSRDDRRCIYPTGGPDQYTGLCAGQNFCAWRRRGHLRNDVRGGLNANGPAFRLTTSGNYTVLASFTGGASGATPVGGLALGADATTNFYGTGEGGGGNAEGTIFRLAVNPNALTDSTLSVLASFYSTTNGSQPSAGITVGKDGKLYGATYYGVGGAWGCFYSMPTKGGAISLLGLFNNGGGLLPKSPPVLWLDGNFYGTTCSGGPGDSGTIYRVTTKGAFTQLVTLGGTNGINPSAPLCIGADGALYGTTYSGIWTNIVTLTATNSLASFGDTNAWKFPQRFYRTAAQ